MNLSRRLFLGLKDKLTVAAEDSAETGGGTAGESSGAPAPTPSLATHAANRLMFGPKPGDIAYIDSIGYDAFLAEQLSFGGINDSACDAKLQTLALVTQGENRAQLYDRRTMDYGEAIRPLEETGHATWVRMIHSKRQLYERMVDFWHNHFNIFGWDYIIESMWPDWDRTLRNNAMGNFRTMIEATTKHPCMLYYLDNYISTNAGPNENYARELCERHTLGAMNYQVPGGYIDQDVYEISRCFTGWTFEMGSTAAGRGDFKYNTNDHDRFIKLVLGQLILGDQPALKDGNDVLDLIAYHPGTARHIATKLAIRFIGPEPSQEIIQSTADVFYAKRYDAIQIYYTIAHLLSSDEFKNARVTKFKRPVDWVASTVRALGMDYTTADSWRWLYDRMGMPQFGWRTPDGPPEDISKWLTTNGMLQRWNWIFRIATGWYEDDGMLVPTGGLLPAGVTTPAGIAQFWIDRVIQRQVSTATHDAVTNFVADGHNWNLPLSAGTLTDKSHYCAALCTMTPEFMLH